MTAALVTSSIDNLAKLLDIVGAKQEAASSRVVAGFARTADPKQKLAALLKIAEPQHELPSRWTGTKVNKILPSFRAYRDALNALAPKAGGELSVLIAFLERFESADVTELIEAMGAAREAFTARKSAGAKKKAAKPSSAADPTVVARYADRLKAALGRDDDFGRAFADLKGDKSIRAVELAEIAKLLLPYPPSKPDRKQIWKAIEDYHVAARGLDLKLKATHGRTAA